MITFRLIICILLFPLTIWYAVGVAIRNISYHPRIRKPLHPDIPTIGIGNLRMGGTGKTPHTEYLIRLLEKEKKLSTFNSQFSISLLSRGYGRKTKGFFIADDHSTARDIGDEPLMMHRKFPDITVAVCKDRNEGLRLLSALNPQPSATGAVLLDDCYQHRKVTPDLNILLTQYSDLYVDDHVLPFGNLREFRSGSRRADIIIVTKCPPLLSPQKRQKIRDRFSTNSSTIQQLNNSTTQPIFFSYIDYSSPLPLFNSQFSILNFQFSTLLLVSGIANPEPLKRHLERHCTVSHLNFPDHHKFTKIDCELILKRYNKIKASNKAIVTTEKDAMRLLDSPYKQLFDGIPFFFVPIEVKFFEQNDFDNTILNFFHNFANSK